METSLMFEACITLLLLNIFEHASDSQHLYLVYTLGQAFLATSSQMKKILKQIQNPYFFFSLPILS